MNATQLFKDAEKGQSNYLSRAEVIAVHETGVVLVAVDNAGQIECDVLHTLERESLQLAPGNSVLLWLPQPRSGRGVILGRIGPAAPARAEIPDELVLEATKNLTIKCGDGSITIRDGRILIKGKDLVSHARRTNRIKGGAVSIN
jgi:hypothetical protein